MLIYSQVYFGASVMVLAFLIGEGFSMEDDLCFCHLLGDFDVYGLRPARELFVLLGSFGDSVSFLEFELKL